VSATSTTARAACALALALVACKSSSDSGNPILPTTRDASSMFFPDGSVPPPSGKVQVTIQDPSDGALLTTNSPASVTAEIKVVDGTDFIEPSSVVAKLTATGSSTVVSSTTLVGPVGSNLYRGQLSLAGIKLGEYVLTVSAATQSGAADQMSVTIKLDNGPQIVVISPVPGGHYKGGLIVQLSADAGAYPDLKNLMGTAGGIAMDLEPVPGQDNQYRATVDFTQASPPLMGEQLFIVSAENGNGARTEVRFVFVVDNEGPVISQVLPTAGTVLPPIVEFSAVFTDDAGVNPDTVQVVISDMHLVQDYVVPLRPDGTGAWSAFFDTHQFPLCKVNNNNDCLVRPTLSFRGADMLGNASVLAFQVAVDNIPPIADLTPPEIRDEKLDDGVRCSFAFDPLSNNTLAGDMPDDLCMVPQLFDLRARIEDDGNRGGGIKVIPISLVDQSNTAIYVQDDVSQPLVVDTDGDGYCDAINPHLVPTTMPLTSPMQVLKVGLAPVPTQGDADFRTDPSVSTEEPSAICVPGRDLSPPPPLCIGNEPTVAIKYAGEEPAIWTLQPIGGQYCFGPQFDTLANNIREDGWKCIAALSTDFNGNSSTSAPIRVWVDYNYDGKPGGTVAATFPPWCSKPPASAGPPPACTGVYDRTSDTVTPGPCQTRNFTFPTRELCFQHECD
jgi:hypothetical protein